ncbi:molybdopterin cofactor-binding domain-containing protein [Pseudonocardia sp.]|uniref:molybdopterin cofactor-binding domain-containing protein n=1 Tax=Pseudonocardia sp. TaxID=60912 RepID=UPI002623339A|nr:molybdopterin cofactor-binding domain-containing protein [Pseudonocardia sp.]
MASPTQAPPGDRPGRHRAVTSIEVDRRKFLTYLISGATLTIATYAGLETLSGSSASAQPIPSGPHPIDFQDLGDILIASYKPTFNLMRLEVLENGHVRFELPRTDVGTGITTAMAMVIADEMDVPFENVEVPMSDARPELLFNMLTGGSCTMRAMVPPVRALAALARGQLIKAAANMLDVPPGTIRTLDGYAVDNEGREIAFGDLSSVAAQLDLPLEDVPVKTSAELNVVGTPMPQIQARDICTGKFQYTLDIPVEGAMPVVWARPPQILGSFTDFDASEVLAMPGVIGVEPITSLENIEWPVDGGQGSYNSGIAIMAETFGQALKAVEKMKATWTPGPSDGVSDPEIFDRLRREALPLLVPALGAQTVEGEFTFATCAHAPMETQTAIADVREDSAEIWVATKVPILAQQFIAKAVGLPVDKVTVHVIRAGGSFGSRLFPDAALEAAVSSKAFGRPVKFMYSRGDDTKHGRKRGARLQKLRLTMLGDSIAAYEQRMTNVYCDLSHGLGEILTAQGAVNLPGQAGFAEAVFRFTVHAPYNLGAIVETINEVDLNHHTAAMRQVYSPTAGPPLEVLIDEAAEVMGKDPVELRKELVKEETGRKVIEKVAEMGNWGRDMAPGTAQGFGYYFEYRSHNAWLVEIDCNGDEPVITAAYGATSTGFPINPMGIEAQMLGGLADGISQTLRASLHIDNGAVREKSYSDFKYTKQKTYPNNVEIHVFPDDGRPIGGIGEHAVAGSIAAVANAYARATGTKVRDFPINHNDA